LKSQGLQADVYHRDCRTACGINPCAWGTSRDFFELVRAAGLHPEKYILQATDHVWMEDVRIPGDLMTFDKPALIQDLLQGTTIKKDPLDVTGYDRVIDATGISRSYLPPFKETCSCLVFSAALRRASLSRIASNSVALDMPGFSLCPATATTSAAEAWPEIQKRIWQASVGSRPVEEPLKESALRLLRPCTPHRPS